MKFKILVIALFLCAACARKQKNDGMLFGTWEKKGNAPLAGSGDSLPYHLEINFGKNENYSAFATYGDVVTKTQGKYVKKTNPDRSLGTIILIPDVQILGKDTIWPVCETMDIVKNNTNAMILKMPVKFISVNGKTNGINTLIELDKK